MMTGELGNGVRAYLAVLDTLVRLPCFDIAFWAVPVFGGFGELLRAFGAFGSEAEGELDVRARAASKLHLLVFYRYDFNKQSILFFKSSLLSR